MQYFHRKGMAVSKFLCGFRLNRGFISLGLGQFSTYAIILSKVAQMPNPRTAGEMKSKRNKVIILFEFS